MNLYDMTADTLKCGVVTAVIIAAIGLIGAAMELSWSDDILWIGVLVLILTPMFGIIVSWICLMMEGERKWVAVASVLIAVVIAGTIVAWFI